MTMKKKEEKNDISTPIKNKIEGKENNEKQSNSNQIF